MKTLWIATVLLCVVSAGCGDSYNRSQTAKDQNARATDVEHHDADNTARNTRDAAEDAVTPFSQGETEADLKITQQIRQALMEDDTLSFNAKNVKVITRDGKVTLRGPVKSETEQTKIVSFATGVAGALNVTNQLEIEKS